MTDLSEQLSPREEAERGELVRSYQAVFSSVEGKRVLFDIFEMCGVYSAAFTGDNNATNFRLGMQEVGKRLISKLDGIDARMYPQLLLTIAEMNEMTKAANAVNKGQEDHDIDA